jgi:ribosomal protein S6--L-glutamate ligase
MKIITDNDSLFSNYHELGNDDIIVGRIRLKPHEEHLLLDLSQRGVRMMPSAVSQLASRSKTMQARIFSKWMLPLTLVAYTQHDVLEAVNLYGKNNIDRVVTKHDGKNAGMGIHLWSSIEDVYSQASFGAISYPFVIQPYVSAGRDIRVIILGEYLEPYERRNPHNFRNNLHCGGESRPCKLSRKQLDISREVMARGDFPYGHVDIMVTGDGTSYLTEINLKGGMRGAQISPAEYSQRVEKIHQAWLQEMRGG